MRRAIRDRLGWGLGLGLGLLLAACATSPQSGSRTADSPASARRGKSSQPLAQRLYQAGEDKFAAGHPEEAVALWRSAIAKLPQTEHYDGLRHKLILRLGFGEVVAYHHTGKLVHLFDGKRTLDRYLVVHESLFGTTEVAKRERGQVYEVLYELESRIEDPPENVSPQTAVGLVDAADEEDAAAELPAREPAPKKRRRGRKADDAEGDHRVVVVDTHDRPSVDDPEMKRKLAAWGPEDGLVLTRAGVEPWLPARAYVRIDGLPRRLDGGGSGPRAPAVAADLVRSVRPALRACYDSAYARVPADFALATFEVAVADDGTVSEVRVGNGVVGDALGDACVLEQLGKAKVSAGHLVAMTVEVDLMFFYDGAVMFNEGGGRSLRNELDLVVDGLARSTSARRRSARGGVPSRMPTITED